MCCQCLTMLLCPNSSLVAMMLGFYSLNTCKVASKTLNTCKVVSKTWGVTCPLLWKTLAINNSVSFHRLRMASGSHLPLASFDF